MSKNSKLKEIAVMVCITILYLVCLIINGNLTVDSSVFGNGYELIDLITSLSSFALFIVLMYLKDSEKALRLSVISGFVLMLINPLLAFPTLASYTAYFVSDKVFDIKIKTKNDKKRLLILAFFFVLTSAYFYVWAFNEWYYFIAVYTGFGFTHFYYVAAFFILVFTALYFTVPKLSGKIKSLLLKAVPILFCLMLALAVYAVKTAISLKIMNFQISTAMTALTLTIFKTGKQIITKLEAKNGR